MTTKTLADFGLPKDSDGKYEVTEQSLSKFDKGTIFKIIGFEMKNLGENPGVIFDMAEPVKDSEGIEWLKAKTANVVTVSKFGQIELEDGDVLEVELQSGGSGSKIWKGF